MKKNNVLIACLLSFFATGALAQQSDTLNHRDTLQRKPNPALQQPAPARTTTPALKQDQYRNPNNVMIHQDDLPATLRESLQHNQYKGWENSTIYQDKTTGEYSMDINDGSGTTPQTYRFDRNGRPIHSSPKQKSGARKDQ